MASIDDDTFVEPEIYLIRHVEPEWSLSGRHTGVSDISLTEHGRQQARLLAQELATRHFKLVLTSPLRRARETCEGGGPGGETAEQVGIRVDRVIARVRAVGSDAALFAHGHVLRVLAARWLGLAPRAGAHFLLDTGALCVLSSYGKIAALQRWNVPPSRPLRDA